MSRSRERSPENPDAKIYIGELSPSITKQDLEDAFSYYGPIRHSWVARNPPGFAFLEFEDPRDAEDALKDTEGSRQYSKRLVCGKRIRVELFNKSGGGSKRSRSAPDNRCYSCGRRGHYAKDCRSRRSDPRSRRGGSYRERDRDRDRDRYRDRSDRDRDRDRDRDSRRRRSPYDKPSRERDRERYSSERRRDDRSRSRSKSRSKSRSRSSSDSSYDRRKKKKASDSSFESR